MDKLDALKSRLSPEDQALLDTLILAQQTEQAAEAFGHQFKSADPPAIDYDKLADTIIAKTKADGEVASADGVAADDATEDDPADESGDDLLLTTAEIDAIATAVAAKIAPMVTKAAEPAPDPQVATVATKAADLESKILELTKELHELKGDQPRSNGYRASQDDNTVTQTAEKAGPQTDPYIIRAANEAAARFNQ